MIGVLQQGVPFQEALKTYTVLTVGDGLVTLIPSLLVSVAGGMVVTRASSERSLSTDLGAQLFNASRPLWIASAVMTTLALIPGLPKLSFILMAVIMAALAYRSKSNPENETKAITGTVAAKSETAPAQTVDPMDAALKLDELMLEVGVGLVPLVDANKGGQLSAKSARCASIWPHSWVSWCLHPHHRQLDDQRFGICHSSAWCGNRAVGDEA